MQSAPAQWLLSRSGPAGADWALHPMPGQTGVAETGSIVDIVPRGHTVLLLAPARDVRLDTVRLPALTREELREAIPYALEESVAGAVDALHLALGPRIKDRQFVFSVDRARLAAWLHAVAQAGGTVSAVLPEWCLLDPHSPHWTIDTRAGELLLCGPDGAGVTLRESGADALWPTVAPPHGSWIVLKNELPVWASRLVAAEGLAYEPVAPEDLVTRVRRVARPWQIDLLSDGLDAHGARGGARASFLLAAVAALALAFAAMSAWLDMHALQDERRHWDTRAAQAYRSAFPAEGEVADIRRRLAIKVRSRAASGARSPLPTLALLAPHLAQSDALALTALRYDGSAVEAEIAARTLSELQVLAEAVRNSGPTYRVTLRSPSASQEGARATLHVASPGETHDK